MAVATERRAACDVALAAGQLRELIAEVQLATAPDHRSPLRIDRPRDQALLLNRGA
jgi:hypothetical protein